MANLTGTAFNDTLVSTSGDDVLDGAAGIDTAYYANATAGVTLDLTVTGPQATGGAGSDTLISIENITGSAFDDKLTGDSGANVLIGGAGVDTLRGGDGDDTLRGGASDDILDGGAGYDYADYSDASAAVTVSLALAGPQATGGAGQDALGNIEGLVGSGYADVLTGDGGANKLFGGAGNDTLRGGAGDDTLDGGYGDNILDGGDGFDTVDYSLSYYGLTVDLAQGSVFSGLGRDTLTGIERVIGSLASDTLKAGSVSATLVGGMGHDNLYSGAGDDTLDGGDGDDVFYLGAGADKISGGAGSDTVHFIGGATALSLDLSVLWAGGQYASGGLTITEVEVLGSVTGGVMNDMVVVGESYTATTTLSGGGGDDRLTGGGGSDTMNGDDGDDVLNGGGGRDFITGGAGADTLNGGAGDDALIMDASDRAVDGGAGVDSLSFEWGTNKYASQALNIDLTNLWTGGAGLINGAEIRGVEKIEMFNGSDLADRVIWGAGPADASNRLTVSLGGGNDYAVGGAMGDNLNGDAGDDTLYGGDGGDFLSGGDGVDWLYGGNGDDTFYASTNDTIDGGAGRDVLRAFGSASAWNIDLRGLWTGGTGTINGGTITNVEDSYDIYGSNEADTIIVGDGLITQITYYYGEIAGREAYNGMILRGYAGDDTIVGSGGADKIYGGLGADKVSGGAGDDIIVFDGKDTVDGGVGVDTLVLGDWYYRSGEALDLDMTGNWEGAAGSKITSIERFYGGYGSDYSDHIIIGDKYKANGVEIYAGSGDDIVVGTGVADTLYGSDGADQLSGGEGDDVLSGSIGNDFLDGGAGNDTAIFDGNTADFSWTLNSDGSLTVRDLRDPATYAYAYSGVDTLRGIEVLRFSDKSITLSSKAGVTLNGTAGADQLTGGAYDDVLNGAGGDDVLIGDLGDDVLDGGDGMDIVSFAGALGPVTVQLRLTGQQQNTGAGLDKLISIEGVIGSAYADKLYGSSGADLLKGGAGDDVIGGDSGDDTIDGGDGYDIAEYGGYSTSYSLTKQADGSWIITDLTGTLFAGSDKLLNVEALRFQDKTINLTDMAGVINGSAGDDALIGTSGNDVFKAGAGNDSIASSAGDDIYDGGEGNDFLGFNNASRGITVDLAVSTPQETGEGRDTFISIDSIIGSRFNDVFRGTDGYNQLNGEGGDDLIEGRGGDDNLSGGAGADVLRGGAGNDIMSGGSGDDELFGDDGDDTIVLSAETTGAGVGGDTIDGGAGFDTLMAPFFEGGVVIDLGRTDRQMIASGSWVTLKNIENLTGSTASDHLTGDAGNNVITGWEGDDVIDGGKGVDTVVMRGASTDFNVTWTGDGWKIADRRPNAPPSSGQNYEGVDTVRNVEYIIYSDKTVALGDGMMFFVGNILRNTGGAGGALASDLSARLESGALTQAAAVTEIVKAAGASTSVATLAYEFFTGKIPGEGGIDYLVSPTGPNPNNLNSAYYQSFNLENRYINFAVNLGKNGEGKDAFLAKYGSLSFVDATREVYKTIFGAAPSDTQIHAMIDTRVDYFAAYGGDGREGIGTKAAMVGWLLAEAQKADLGVMVRSNDAWLKDLADGSAPFAVDILDPAKGYYKADFIFGGA